MDTTQLQLNHLRKEKIYGYILKPLNVYIISFIIWESMFFRAQVIPMTLCLLLLLFLLKQSLTWYYRYFSWALFYACFLLYILFKENRNETKQKQKKRENNWKSTYLLNVCSLNNINLSKLSSYILFFYLFFLSTAAGRRQVFDCFCCRICVHKH